MRKSWAAAGIGTGLMGVIGIGLIAADKPANSKTVSPKAVVPAEMPRPEYDQTGALLQPVGFEKWVVVGTSVGLGYSDGEKTDPNNPGQFHNVYLQPQAFDHYVATGEFPEQTVFIVTNNPSQSTKRKGDHTVLRQGFFAAPTAGLEVSVKDTSRFADGWGYYIFHDKTNNPPAKVRTAEQAFARKECYDCHAEHGAVDHVFTQFYSVLTAAREQHLAEEKPAK
jgi:hypothetical protein